MLVMAVAAAFVAAGSATGDPSVSAKQAQAASVMTQIRQLDASLERARNRYEAASQKLRLIEHSLTITFFDGFTTFGGVRVY